MSHAGIGFCWRGKHFNQNMEIIIEVEVLRFSTFPQLFFLKKEKSCLKGCHCKKRKRKGKLPELIWHVVITRGSPNSKHHLKEESLKRKSDLAVPRPLWRPQRLPAAVGRVSSPASGPGVLRPSPEGHALCRRPGPTPPGAAENRFVFLRQAKQPSSLLHWLPCGPLSCHKAFTTI